MDRNCNWMRYSHMRIDQHSSTIHLMLSVRRTSFPQNSFDHRIELEHLPGSYPLDKSKQEKTLIVSRQNDLQLFCEANRDEEKRTRRHLIHTLIRSTLDKKRRAFLLSCRATLGMTMMMK